MPLKKLLDSKLSLREANTTGRLGQFISEQTGLHGNVGLQEFDSSVCKIVKAHQPQDQTSSSRVRGGSTGK